MEIGWTMGRQKGNWGDRRDKQLVTLIQTKLPPFLPPTGPLKPASTPAACSPQ